MTYVSGGELFFHMDQSATFDEPTARYYAAEITLALECVPQKRRRFAPIQRWKAPLRRPL